MTATAKIKWQPQAATSALGTLTPKIATGHFHPFADSGRFHRPTGRWPQQKGAGFDVVK